MKPLVLLSLRAKLLLLVLLVGVPPLVVSAVVGLADSRALMQQSAEALLQSRAEGLAHAVDSFHESLQRASLLLSLQPAVGRYCVQPRAAEAAVELARILQAYTSGDERLRGVAVFDPTGTVIAATESGLPGNNYSFRRFVREGLQGSAVTSELYLALPEVGSLPSLAYATPVREGIRVVGLAVVFARAAALWDLVRGDEGRSGPGSSSVVLDQHGVRVAHSSDLSVVFHPAGRMEAAETDRLVAERRFGDQTRSLLEQPVPLEGAFRRARGEALPASFTLPMPGGGQGLAVSVRLRSVPWSLFTLVPEATLDAPVTRLLWRSLLVNLAMLLLALAVGLFLAGRILRPVAALSVAAERFKRGDFHARVPHTSRDELGALGETFNAMAEQIAAWQVQLEEQVRGRTEALGAAKQHLESQNAALAQRTAELTERQDRDLVFARTLSLLAGPGHLREVTLAALTSAEDYLRTLVVAAFRVDKERLVPVSALGGVAKPLALSGRVAEALKTRKPVVVDSLPEDSELRFDAGLAQGKPRSLALVPLTMGDRDVGLLVAGFPAPPAAQQLAFLVELALPLALTIGRSELHEQTERFALQLAQRNEVLRTQSDELAAQQAQLTQKNAEIGRANQLKSEFLANMSHELRTPLNAVIGFSELMLEEEGKLPPGHGQFVRDILASGRHLLSLINSVLDLAKIEAGKVALDTEPLDAREQVQHACALVSGLAQQKRLTLTQTGRAARTVRADRGKLQQVLLNLLSNAIKFSDEGTRVEISVEERGDQVRFAVRDQGPGISEKVRSELFQPFVQGETSLSKKHEGAGLGLAITRRLVEQQGGEVGVDSELGKGSTFWVLLPADERRPAAAPIALGPAGPPPAREPSPPPGPAASGDRPLVLVIEDDAANARLLRFHLENAGYAVAEAHRAREALELAARLRPALILLDLILPEGEDGSQVLRALRERPATAQVPVVVVSVVQETRRVRELGVAAWFVKPIDGGKLLEVVQQLCPPGAPPQARATVLVVDDHDMNRELARTLLERRGCRVLLARDGLEGTRVARAEHPDLVLMDLAMPVKDGLTAARELKADRATAGIPLIAFTALAMRGDEERALKSGFDGYLSKPIDKNALEATLSKFLPPAGGRT